MPSLYYIANTTIVAAPSDTNDGRDRFGFALDNAQFTPGRALVKTGAFSGYTHAAGDIVAINNRGDPPAWGWYLIDAKDDDDTLVLGDLVIGTDIHDSGTTIDVDSSDGPWSTLQTLQSSEGKLITDDNVRVCGDGEHFVTAQISTRTDTYLGEAVGADARGRIPAGAVPPRVTIRKGTGLSASGNLVNRWAFFSTFNLDFDGQDTNDARITGSLCLMYRGFNDPHIIVNCSFRRAGSGSTALGRFSANSQVWLCRFVDGYMGSSTVRSGVVYWGCLFANNTKHGWDQGNEGTRFIASLFLTNGWAGIGSTNHNADGSTNAHINGCVFYGNGASGANLGTTSSVFNSSFYNNGGYGVRLAGGRAFGHNHSHGNTSGHTDLVSDGDYGDLGLGSNVTGDPLFKDAENGDFTPQEGSPLLNAGIDAGGLT